MQHFIRGYFDGDGSCIIRNHNGNVEYRADISGTLSTHKITDSDIGIGMVTNMALEVFDVHFTLDNTPLDANNDGFLDCKQ